jgi:hypothetical protein
MIKKCKIEIHSGLKRPVAAFFSPRSDLWQATDIFNRKRRLATGRAGANRSKAWLEASGG